MKFKFQITIIEVKSFEPWFKPKVKPNLNLGETYRLNQD